MRHERLPFTETRLGVEHVNISPNLTMPLHHIGRKEGRLFHNQSRQPMLSCHRCCNARHFPERSCSLGMVLAEHLFDEVFGNDEGIFVNAWGALSQHRHWPDRVHQFLLSGMINLVKTRWLPSSTHRFGSEKQRERLQHCKTPTKQRVVLVNLLAFYSDRASNLKPLADASEMTFSGATCVPETKERFDAAAFLSLLLYCMSILLFSFFSKTQEVSNSSSIVQTVRFRQLQQNPQVSLRTDGAWRSAAIYVAKDCGSAWLLARDDLEGTGSSGSSKMHISSSRPGCGTTD